ncbi:unnamed protein product [Sphagnum balticum]
MQLSTEVKFKHARLECNDWQKRISIHSYCPVPLLFSNSFILLFFGRRNREVLRTLLQEQQRLMWEN